MTDHRLDERLGARLDDLRREYTLGEGRLRELVQQESALRETLLRISGAIQVLEELTAGAPIPADPSATPDPADRAPQPAGSGPPDGGHSDPAPRILTVP